MRTPTLSAPTNLIPATYEYSPLATCLVIREKALEMFAEYGFQAVSLRKLAGAIGIHPGSLYCHIKNKHALLFELIEDHEDDLLETLKTAISNSSPPGQLRAYIRAGLTYLNQHSKHATVAKHETRHLRIDQQNCIKKIKNKQHELLERIIKNHLKNQEKRHAENLQTLCQCTQLIIENFADWHLLDPTTSLDTLHDLICCFITSLHSR
ncbi:TetR family transcriptional regulator [Pseudomonas sp. SJZ103]|uniref:TetR/AcrR family transcriptional regulator n=1 Tax=unclassified Pseudomonas TaxID=196821 RepID=UPI0011AC1FB8|nr:MULTISPECIES: TetR/AcrR family transcriptional regulator [unclassified Pseudomonas]TWC63019.1 TetR family transcriptional regulator [Pseudomonas sp. SJZ103]TWC80292.1 TetR family transcriptional regulator [Pseudomonas sp. SJZ094]